MLGLRAIGRWSLVVLAWCVTAALGLADLVSVRSCVLQIMVIRGANAYQLSAVDKWSILPLGLLWLGTVLYVQYHYGGAALMGFRILGLRWLRITLVQVAVFLVFSSVSLVF